MLPIEGTFSLPAASATGIATAQTLGAAGPLTLNGSYVIAGVATMPSSIARRVLLTFAADETGHNFTVTGTSRSGVTQSEVLAGTAAGTVQSNLDYLTVTSIVSSAATTGNVSAGSSGVGSSRWLYLSAHMTPTNYSASVVITPTVNVTLEYCLRDPAGHPYDFPRTGPLNVAIWKDANINGATVNANTIGTAPATAVRFTINSGTGTVGWTVLQAGISGP